MKAVIICSVHALCNMSELERNACNLACQKEGIPAILTREDHARLVSKTTMLEFLLHLPGSKKERQALVDRYLDILNEAIWSTSLTPHESVLSALLDPMGFARPTGFLSDYPILTTNLVRASALTTSASRLGLIAAPSDPFDLQSTKDGLAEIAASLEVSPCDVEVMVSHTRDVVAARALGMRPRFVKEAWSSAEIIGEEAFDVVVDTVHHLPRVSHPAPSVSMAS